MELTRDKAKELFSICKSEFVIDKIYDSFENKINNLNIALNKANKRKKAQAEEISQLLANKQAVSDLKDKYDRLELKYVEMRSSLNIELREHKAIIKYLEGKLK